MWQFAERVAACIGLVALCAFAPPSCAQQSPVTAIDILLDPDSTMIQHAEAANARLLKAFPNGFSLDADHRPHITLLQRFVRTADLDKVYAAADKTLAGEKLTAWKLTAIKYYFVAAPPIGVAGIVIAPTDDLLRLQQELLDAVAPFTVETGTAEAFFTLPGEPEINPGLIPYVAGFAPDHTGKNYRPPCQRRRGDHRLSGQDARGAVRRLHLLARFRLDLPARRFRNGAQEAQGSDGETLSATPRGLPFAGCCPARVDANSLVVRAVHVQGSNR